MGGDTVFSGPVHIVGADLYFKGLPGRTDQRRVQRLVHVCLGHGNIVFKAAGYGLVHLMDSTEDSVAVPDRSDDHAHGKKIINLLKGFILIDHLPVNTEEVLDPSVHSAFDAGLFDMVFDLLRDFLHIVLSLALSLLDLFHKVEIDIRI